MWLLLLLQALELQSRFAADDRFRLSERFWESEGEDDPAAAGGTSDGDGGEPRTALFQFEWG